MSKLNFSVKLVDKTSDINKKILQALSPQIETFFNKISKQIENDIPNIIIDSIKNQPEYAALMGGVLQGEFGIPDPATRLSSILDTIKSGSVVKVKPVSISGNKISAGIKLQMIQKDFADLLSLGDATVVTENGNRLNWLQWLLIEGDSVIVSDYQFVAGPNPGSRTGMGIMQQFTGAFWRVPPEYAGTITNNWITRAIDSASSTINGKLESLLK